MAEKDKPEQANTITAEVAAKLIRLKERRFYQLVSEGWIKKPYTVVSVVHGYLDFKEDAEKRAQLKAADNEVRRARAREIELRTAKSERELVPAEEADALVQMIVGQITAKLQGLPARYTRDVTERNRLETLVDDIRTEVADLAAQYAENFRSGGELAPADEEAAS